MAASDGFVHLDEIRFISGVVDTFGVSRDYLEALVDVHGLEGSSVATPR